MARNHRRLAGTRAPLALFVAVAALVATPLPSLASGGGGGGGMSGGMGGSSSAPRVQRTPEEIAQDRYEKGLQQRDYALDYERKAAETEAGFWHNRHVKNAKKYWARAIDSYKAAIENKPRYHEAYSDLGFALRKTGDYEASLAAYEKSLEIRPGYPRALEYLGEAYLGLKRLDDAQKIYLRLFVIDRELAAELMSAMVSWVESPESGADQEAFKAWVEERRQLAEQADGDVSESGSW